MNKQVGRSEKRGISLLQLSRVPHLPHLFQIPGVPEESQKGLRAWCSGPATNHSFGICCGFDGLGNLDNKPKVEHYDAVQILWLFFGTKVGNNNWQRFVKAGVRNSKKKTTVRLTRGHAQNEEQPLGVSFRCLVKQPPQTRSQPRETQNCILDGRELDSRTWPNANQRFGTVYLDPSNQSIPSTKKTSHGPGLRLFEQMHRLNSWINFEP